MIYIPNQTGVWSDANSWNKTSNVPTIHASTNINIDLTAKFSPTFTAPSLINFCKGALIYITTKASTLPTLTLTLQENSIDTIAVGTVDTSLLTANGTWIYIKFPVPYLFTSLTADYYRFKLVSNSATITTVAMTATTLFHFLAVDDRTGVPVTTDQVFIADDISTPVTITIDGTQTIGNGGTVLNTQRILQDAVKCLAGGILKWDTTANSTLNCNGCFQVYSNGEMQIGTVATPYPDAYLAKLIFTPSTSGDYGMAVYDGGRKQLHGKTKLLPVNYVSGSGITSNPLITDGNIGEVGDELIILPSVDSSDTPYIAPFYKHIIIKNSDTSYVLSQSSGGTDGTCTLTIASPCEVTLASHGYLNRQRIMFTTTGALPTGITANTTYFVISAGLTANTFRFSATFNGAAINTSGTQSGIHTVQLATATVSINSEVLNIQRNVIITTNDITKGWYQARQESTIAGNVDISFARLENVGSTTAGKTGYYMGNVSNSTLIFDDNVSYGAIGTDNIFLTITSIINTYSRNISCKGGSNVSGFKTTAALFKTFTDCYAIDCNSAGFILGGLELTLNNCKSINCGAGTNFGGFAMLGATDSILNDCESHLCNISFYLSSATNVRVNSAITNTKGLYNVAINYDIKPSTGYLDIVFNDCYFGRYGTSSFIENYLAIGGGGIKFHKIQNTDYQHEVYTKTGRMFCTGAGLADTTVRTNPYFAITKNIKLSPENLTNGLSWSFKVNAKANTNVFVTGFIKKNALMVGSVVQVELYLPLAITPAATMIMPDDEIFNPFGLYANYVASVNGFATLKITAFSSTIGAAIYVADIYNGTNDISNLNTWEDALPSELMVAELFNADAIMGVLMASATTAGTFGKIINDIKTIIDNINVETGEINTETDGITIIDNKIDNLKTIERY